MINMSNLCLASLHRWSLRGMGRSGYLETGQTALGIGKCYLQCCTFNRAWNTGILCKRHYAMRYHRSPCTNCGMEKRIGSTCTWFGMCYHEPMNIVVYCMSINLYLNCMKCCQMYYRLYMSYQIKPCFMMYCRRRMQH